MRSLFYQQARGTLCLCIKITHLHDTKCKSQSSAHGFMIRAQYCWPRGFSCLEEVKSKSMCQESEPIFPGSHSRISGNQMGVPKLYMLLSKSLTPVPFLQACSKKSKICVVGPTAAKRNCCIPTKSTDLVIIGVLQYGLQNQCSNPN